MKVRAYRGMSSARMASSFKLFMFMLIISSMGVFLEAAIRAMSSFSCASAELSFKLM